MEVSGAMDIGLILAMQLSAMAGHGGSKFALPIDKASTLPIHTIIHNSLEAQ